MVDGKTQRIVRLDAIAMDARSNQVATSEFSTIKADDLEFLITEAAENIGRFRFKAVVVSVSNKPNDGGVMEIKLKTSLSSAIALESCSWLSESVLVLIDAELGQKSFGFIGEEPNESAGELFDKENDKPYSEAEDDEGPSRVDETGNPVEEPEEFDDDGNPIEEEGSE